MTTTLNAVTSTGLVQTSDGSGVIKVQSNGVTTNALAWVQFAGSTGTIASSYNVSSVTRNGTGDYSVTMTNATSDINYSCIASTSASSASSSRQIIQVFTSSTGLTVNAPTTTVFRLNTVNAPTGVNYDSNYVCTAIFGN